MAVMFDRMKEDGREPSGLFGQYDIHFGDDIWRLQGTYVQGYV
jgi:hypothetical protein